jgi:hypothetical protein
MIGLRDLTLTIEGYSHLGPVSLRYSVKIDRRGHQRVFWYFADRRLEYVLKDEAVRDAVEGACLLDDARYSGARA